MIECYNEYLYAKVTMIYGIAVFAVPFLFVCIAAGICEIADFIAKKKRKERKNKTNG